MGFNPYEMRWELFQNAESRLMQRHDAQVSRWQSLQDKGERLEKLTQEQIQEAITQYRQQQQ